MKMTARIDEFLIGVKPQREWGWLVITYLFLGGAGAGLFLISLYIDHGWAGALGLVVVILGTGLLLLDLGRPERFWRAFFRPQSSWISRGCFFITLLVALGALQVALRVFEMELPSGIGTAVKLISAAAAVLVMIYTGFVLSPSAAIPFWNSTFFPIIFFAYSLLAGIDILILTSPVLPGPALNLGALEGWQAYLALGCLIFVLSHLSVMSGSATAARESIRLLTRGKWATLFLGGVIGLGLVVPLLLGWPFAGRSEMQTIFVVTVVLAVLRLFGDYLFRFLVIRAGMYDPLL
jgi:formate-dependent nitrite reductase membrane component NrfD